MYVLKVTYVLKKPDAQTQWYTIPIDLYDIYVDNFIYTGELLSLRLIMSEDQLEKTVVGIFQDQAAVDRYFSSEHPFLEPKRAYEAAHNITVTEPIIEALDDVDPYLQEFLFDFSVVNHADCTDEGSIIHDAAYLFVEERNAPPTITYDPKGPAW